MDPQDNNETVASTGANDNKSQIAVFNYMKLRFTMGVIALSLPIVVTLIASVQLSSISASYFTEARNAFVGQLFVVAAFLFA